MSSLDVCALIRSGPAGIGKGGHVAHPSQLRLGSKLPSLRISPLEGREQGNDRNAALGIMEPVGFYLRSLKTFLRTLTIM